MDKGRNKRTSERGRENREKERKNKDLLVPIGAEDEKEENATADGPSRRHSEPHARQLQTRIES